MRENYFSYKYFQEKSFKAILTNIKDAKALKNFKEEIPSIYSIYSNFQLNKIYEECFENRMLAASSAEDLEKIIAVFKESFTDNRFYIMCQGLKYILSHKINKQNKVSDLQLIMLGKMLGEIANNSNYIGFINLKDFVDLNPSKSGLNINSHMDKMQQILTVESLKNQIIIIDYSSFYFKVLGKNDQGKLTFTINVKGSGYGNFFFKGELSFDELRLASLLFASKYKAKAAQPLMRHLASLTEKLKGQIRFKSSKLLKHLNESEYEYIDKIINIVDLDYHTKLTYQLMEKCGKNQELLNYKGIKRFYVERIAKTQGFFNMKTNDDYFKFPYHLSNIHITESALEKWIEGY